MFPRNAKKVDEILHHVLRIIELCSFSRKDLVIIRHEIEDSKQRQHEWFARLHSSQAETNKLLSSIEMELLLARGASLDNNFEGKTDL